MVYLTGSIPADVASQIEQAEAAVTAAVENITGEQQ